MAMNEFEYFLFENFDADVEAANPYNPRNVLGKETDPVITAVANQNIKYQEACTLFGTDLIHRMMDVGVIRCDDTQLRFDCPIFFKEDAATLLCEIEQKSRGLADCLERNISTIRVCCSMIENGFSLEINLYHIICGMIFDGSFFDYLCEKGAVATEREHPSGLNYLSVIYEKCEELQSFSNGLLCSYNRFADATCSLQSFGDADGNRLDFYRLFRCVEQGRIPLNLQEAAKLVTEHKYLNKDIILSEVRCLIKTGFCDSAVQQILEMLGYVENGDLCVPVFLPQHKQVIEAIEQVVEDCLGDVIAKVLIDLANTVKITAVRHGADKLEIANELYHIVFGMINEELVKRNIVAKPALRSGEGRYMKCIVLGGLV